MQVILVSKILVEKEVLIIFFIIGNVNVLTNMSPFIFLIVFFQVLVWTLHPSYHAKRQTVGVALTPKSVARG